MLIVGAGGWGRLVRALEAYQMRGYGTPAVPWHSEGGHRATLPAGSTVTTAYTVGRGEAIELVGSAEQALLDLAARGAIAPRQPVVALTPCFRLDDGDDAAAGRAPYFAKVELFVLDPGPHALDTLIMDAAAVHRQVLGVRTWSSATAEGIDLMIGRLEVGSYGIREAEVKGRPLRWAYGTGLAEPRAGLAARRVGAACHP